MQNSYFDFEFDVPQNWNKQYPEDIKKPFNNTNHDMWFNWQHNELDSDDSLEYDEIKQKIKEPVDQLLTPLSQYDYMKSIKRKVKYQFSNKNVDYSIFQDLLSFLKVFNNSQIKLRQKSISLINSQTIDSYRAQLISQINQKNIFVSLLKQNKPRKSLNQKVLYDIDVQIDNLIIKLELLEDYNFLKQVRSQIQELKYGQNEINQLLQEDENQKEKIEQANMISQYSQTECEEQK